DQSLASIRLDAQSVRDANHLLESPQTVASWLGGNYRWRALRHVAIKLWSGRHDPVDGYAQPGLVAGEVLRHAGIGEAADKDHRCLVIGSERVHHSDRGTPSRLLVDGPNRLVEGDDHEAPLRRNRVVADIWGRVGRPGCQSRGRARLW